MPSWVKTSIAIGVFLVFFIVAVSLYQAWTRRRVQKRLAGRPALTPEEFAKTYFSETPARAEIAPFTRDCLARIVGLDLSGLLPDDSLHLGLLSDKEDFMLELVDLILVLEKRFGIEFPSGGPRLVTFRDLVDCVERAMASEHANQRVALDRLKDRNDEVLSGDEFRKRLDQ